MPVNWSATWNSGDNNDVNPAFGQAEILSIITNISPALLKVQPAAVRDAVALVIAGSADVTIIKGLHHVGTEKIDIKKTGAAPGPCVHLYCMNYSLVDSGLRPPFNDVARLGTGWRITGSSAYEGDGNSAYQGMDKSDEIRAIRDTGVSKAGAQAQFKNTHYG